AREYPQGKKWIVTESVFSMDGDRCDLQGVIELKKRYGAMLWLDEAHAVGMIGPEGRGLAAKLDIENEIEVQMGTLGKAVGASGGYLAGSRVLIDFLINRARSFIFSTAPPAAVAAAALAGVELLSGEEGEQRRRRLWKNLHLFGKGISLPEKAMPVSAIVPIMIGDEGKTLQMAERLWRAGFWLPAVRYPTVAKGAARLRISLSASHSKENVQALISMLKEVSASENQ
ncbi:MAG: aminotransferase class I/II-fold pyridoxal phosphate-dependent enzyme, partial [Chthoniobacterales bacterium]